MADPFSIIGFILDTSDRIKEVVDQVRQNAESSRRVASTLQATLEQVDAVTKELQCGVQRGVDTPKSLLGDLDALHESLSDHLADLQKLVLVPSEQGALFARWKRKCRMAWKRDEVASTIEQANQALQWHLQLYNIKWSALVRAEVAEGHHDLAAQTLLVQEILGSTSAVTQERIAAVHQSALAHQSELQKQLMEMQASMASVALHFDRTRKEEPSFSSSGRSIKAESSKGDGESSRKPSLEQQSTQYLKYRSIGLRASLAAWTFSEEAEQAFHQLPLIQYAVVSVRPGEGAQSILDRAADKMGETSKLLSVSSAPLDRVLDSLHDTVSLLTEACFTHEPHDVAVEAVRICRTLSPTKSLAAISTLSAWLRTLSLLQTGLGKSDEALLTIQEAVTWDRSLTGLDASCSTSLFKSLTVLSFCQFAVGSILSATKSAQKAVALGRRLASADTMEFATLARALHGLSQCQQFLEGPEPGLCSAEEAVDLCRDHGTPADLGRALLFLCATQRDNGLEGEALDSGLEAIAVLRPLSKKRPDFFQADLAEALSVLASCQVKIGLFKEAYEGACEAASLSRTLVQERGQTICGARLADTLDGLARIQGDVGDPLVVANAEEAVAILRASASRGSALDRARLARSLNTLATQQCLKELPLAALASGQEALALARDLLASHSAFRSQSLVVLALENVSKCYHMLQRPEEGLVHIQEALSIQKSLASHSPLLLEPLADLFALLASLHDAAYQPELATKARAEMATCKDQAAAAALRRAPAAHHGSTRWKGKGTALWDGAV